MPILMSWLANTLVALVLAYIMPGITVDNVQSAFIAALMLGIVTSLFGPLVSSMHMHAALVTVGIPTFVASAVAVAAVSGAVPGFNISGFWSALLFALVLAISSYLSYLLTQSGGEGH